MFLGYGMEIAFQGNVSSQRFYIPLEIALCFVGSACSDASFVTDAESMADGAADAPTYTIDASIPAVFDAPTGGCEDSGEIYALGTQGELYRFDPPAKTFTTIGIIDCDNSSGTWSMSVTRDGTAHVLYGDGSIHAVSTDDASCSATSHVAGQSGFTTFGMGYSSDSQGADEETLFVANASGLAKFDTGWTVSPVGTISGTPELTGNAAGELWGFFPKSSAGQTQPHIARIDKASGALSRIVEMPAIAGWRGNYAFAHWGGDYYVFFGQTSLSDSNVYRVDPETGVVEDWLIGSGKRILGAGVSTCAPLVID